MLAAENDIKELLLRITEGEEKAFNELFSLYRDRSYSYLLRITKSKIISEEATLDLFMKIWTGRNMLPEIRDFDAFLFCVLHNSAIDYLRKAKRNRLQQIEIWADLESLSTAPEADEKILHSEIEETIRRVMDRLSPQRRQAFYLSREEDLSYEQIARKMNLSRNTVRNHVSAALDFIRGNLDNGINMGSLLLFVCSR
jgi:RNA polymerase sigma-70 factor (family 1)